MGVGARFSQGVLGKRWAVATGEQSGGVYPRRFACTAGMNPAALFLEQPRAGLEEPPAALVRLAAGLLLAGLQVGQVGQAERAADGAQVELDVILEVRVEGLEQGRAELLAGRAAQPGPPL